MESGSFLAGVFSLKGMGLRCRGFGVLGVNFRDNVVTVAVGIQCFQVGILDGVRSNRTLNLKPAP